MNHISYKSVNSVWLPWCSNFIQNKIRREIKIILGKDYRFFEFMFNLIVTFMQSCGAVKKFLIRIFMMRASYIMQMRQTKNIGICLFSFLVNMWNINN